MGLLTRGLTPQRGSGDPPPFGALGGVGGLFGGFVVVLFSGFDVLRLLLIFDVFRPSYSWDAFFFTLLPFPPLEGCLCS